MTPRYLVQVRIMPYTDLRHEEVESELGLLRLKSAECIWDVSGEVRVSLSRALLTELIDCLMAGGDVLFTPTVGHSEGGSFSTSLFGKSVFCFKTILFIQVSSQSFCVIKKKWRHRTPADRNCLVISLDRTLLKVQQSLSCFVFYFESLAVPLETWQ